MKPFMYLRFSIAMFILWGVSGGLGGMMPNLLEAPPRLGGLGFNPSQIGWIIGLAGGIGAVLAPLIAGQLADRFFSAQRVMAVLLLISGTARIATPHFSSFGAWVFLSILFQICFVPNLTIVNSVIFRNEPNANRNFGMIRVWGSVGFIAVMWAFPMIFLQTGLHLQWMPPFLIGAERADAGFRLMSMMNYQGWLAVICAIYCLFLPNTPPRPDAMQKLAIVPALGLFKKSSFLWIVFIATAFNVMFGMYWFKVGPFMQFIGIPLKTISSVTTVGPFAELLFMPLLFVAIKRLGFRGTIGLFILIYSFEFGVFMLYESLPQWFVVFMQVGHGIGSAAMWCASFMYIDRLSDDKIKHTAQMLFGAVLLGEGGILSGLLLPWFVKLSTLTSGVFSYSHFWAIQFVIGFVAALVFLAFFRDQTKGDKTVLSRAGNNG